MGRKKIKIEQIKDERNKHVTFNKRKSGLIKKAMELSILCDCQISLVIFNAENQLFEYCSTDPRYILQRYCQVAHLPHERLSNNDYPRYDRVIRKSKNIKKGDQSMNEDAGLANEEVTLSEGINVDPMLQQSINNLPSEKEMNAQQNFMFQPQPIQIPRPYQMQQADLQAPLTPNTSEEVQRVLHQSINLHQSMQTFAAPPKLDTPERKRNVEADEISENSTGSAKKRKMERNLTIQVPLPSTMPMRRLEEMQASLSNFKLPTPIQRQQISTPLDTPVAQVFSPANFGQDKGEISPSPISLSANETNFEGWSPRPPPNNK